VARQVRHDNPVGQRVHSWAVIGKDDRRAGDTQISLKELEQQIIACTRCPRLVTYREEVARTKKPAFREQQYWGRPLPGFGDAQARVF
jgi:uracil-DNA glycosylase